MHTVISTAWASSFLKVISIIFLWDMTTDDWRPSFLTEKNNHPTGKFGWKFRWGEFKGSETQQKWVISKNIEIQSEHMLLCQKKNKWLIVISQHGDLTSKNWDLTRLNRE